MKFDNNSLNSIVSPTRVTPRARPSPSFIFIVLATGRLHLQTTP